MHAVAVQEGSAKSRHSEVYTSGHVALANCDIEKGFTPIDEIF